MTSPQSPEPIPGPVRVWLLLSAIICSIDVAFTMLRPASLRGGSLGWLFKGWHIYADVDLRYATSNDLVTHTTGRLMLVEIVMNIVALVMVGWRLVFELTTAFVLWKTLVYFFLFIDVPEGKRNIRNEKPHRKYVVAIGEIPGNPNEIAEGTSLPKLLLIFWFMNGMNGVATLPTGVARADENSGIWVAVPLAVMICLWPMLAR